MIASSVSSATSAMCTFLLAAPAALSASHVVAGPAEAVSAAQVSDAIAALTGASLIAPTSNAHKDSTSVLGWTCHAAPKGQVVVASIHHGPSPLLVVGRQCRD